MILYPAIDIQGGRCVRLYQGDFDRATTHSDDPVEVARRWQAAGADWLHVVDLDAAGGRGDNGALVAAIVEAVAIPVQFGGGLRDEQALRLAFDRGVARAVIGTAAIEAPEFARAAVAAWGERIAIGVDARGGHVAVRGWQATSPRRATELAQELQSWGVRRIIYTDIERDGTLTQPNFEALAELIGLGGPGVIASGGVASLDHLLRLAELGAEGAIVGQALYTDAVDLAAALAALAPAREGTAVRSAGEA